MDAHEYLVQGSLQLGRGSLLRLAGARGLTVHVRTGTLWITEEGDRADHFVQAGGSMRIAGSGVTLVSALKTSSLSITREPLRA